jgi:uncharacterized protein YfiM (DUF2279 family)
MGGRMIPGLAGIAVMVAHCSAAACTPPRLDTLPVAAVDSAERRAAVVPVPGEDKFRHFWASYGAASLTYGALRAVDRDAALPAAIAVSAALGIAKELHDRRIGAGIDPFDLIANAAGIAAAYFFLREIR